jgi:hypothetical protein
MYISNLGDFRTPKRLTVALRKTISKVVFISIAGLPDPKGAGVQVDDMYMGNALLIHYALLTQVTFSHVKRTIQRKVSKVITRQANPKTYHC